MESLSREQKEAFDAILEGESIFLTGPGGTGKSFLIQTIMEEIPKLTGKTIAVTAMTGCAALLIGKSAKTLHGWAGIGLGRGTAQSLSQNIRKIPPLAKRWRETNILIIDEVSMLTPLLLETLDEIAKILRRSQRPFGGMQIIFAGDFLQLPPISKDKVTRFAFESPVWTSLVKRTIQLKQIFRQKDTTFQTILDEARKGSLSKDSLSILETRINQDYKKEKIQPTILFTRRVDVEEINTSHLDKLPGILQTYNVKTEPSEHSRSEVIATSEKMDKDGMYEPILILKEGAQVMLVANLDIKNGLCNGSRGVVVGFQETTNWPIVEFKTERRVIQPYTWESDHKPPIVRSQIPLRLAYALTIHKSQGATLDCALIDIGPSVFEYGQAYVALSRVRNLEGLFLFDICPRAFRAHPLVKSFYDGTYVPPVQEETNKDIPSISVPFKKGTYGFADDNEEPPKEQQKTKQTKLNTYFSGVGRS
jgi:ATP-dependent DNA helicase PIF1